MKDESGRMKPGSDVIFHPPSFISYRSFCFLLLTGFFPQAYAASEAPELFSIPIEFILFALTLIGIALFHRHTLAVALTGLAAVIVYKFVFTGFREGDGIAGFVSHLGHEWVVLTNLLGLLLGFALLSNHFEESRVPDALPRILPEGWAGAFSLLAIVFVLSSFLDNIAAAIIGGTMAATLFKRKVHIGYLAAIVAASNAGGSGSVIGDTTTTMMWIDGVAATDVLHAYVAAFVALFVFGIPAAIQQNKHSSILADPHGSVAIDWMRVVIVAAILIAAIATNVIINLRFANFADSFPFIGAAVWVALVACAALRQPNWKLLPEALKGSIFLVSLVLVASLMPVEKLPDASWQTTLGLGFVSAVFDNIPLTALALEQGGYDWGMLAYTVGFGGSMIWFGSSAGVALSNLYPEARSVGRWIKGGWHVVVAYVAGFFVLYFVLGWQPHERAR